MYDFCKGEHFAALKRGGAVIRGGAIFDGNTVITKSEFEENGRIKNCTYSIVL